MPISASAHKTLLIDDNDRCFMMLLLASGFYDSLKFFFFGFLATSALRFVGW